ncbi:hypothetical protein NPIL_373071 [Nephila pilipes]|uniref:Uncharacterized protein n=1 Tax=Nephila pilipes TaxID=299642 RepID=A0A8X6MTJ8_NEPPI|nr:hypothetical protein NPIL_373071 [Nephila pilipes]
MMTCDISFHSKHAFNSTKLSNPFEHDTTPNGGDDEWGVNGSTCNGHRNSNCPSSRHLAMVRTDTEAHSEGATCVWMMDYVQTSIAPTVSVSSTIAVSRAS